VSDCSLVVGGEWDPVCSTCKTEWFVDWGPQQEGTLVIQGDAGLTGHTELQRVSCFQAQFPQPTWGTFCPKHGLGCIP
jgi:hypothetical protein